jgi:hypothetical protein
MSNITGKYEYVSSENFDEYLKAMGKLHSSSSTTQT